MKTKILLIVNCLIFALLGCSNNVDSDEWLTLFNGKDLKNWEVKIHHYDVGNNYGDTFRVEDGMMKVRYDQYDFTDEFGHIYYKTPFSNFHLSVDYRFSGKFEEGAPNHAMLNSGVMFHSQSAEAVNKEQNWPVSIEMQYLADLGYGKRTTGNMCSPGTNVIHQGKIFPEHCLQSSIKALPKNEWVTAELIVKGENVTQLINGQVVLEYSNPTFDGKDNIIKGLDSGLFQHGKALASGYIALQSEGQPVEFKNIRIKVLD